MTYHRGGIRKPDDLEDQCYSIKLVDLATEEGDEKRVGRCEGYIGCKIIILLKVKDAIKIKGRELFLKSNLNADFWAILNGPDERGVLGNSQTIKLRRQEECSH